MTARKKSKLENFFSWKRHKRRIGAKKIENDEIPDFGTLKERTVDEGDIAYTHGSSSNLSEHLNDLRKEFHGRKELEFYHARLNVLLRREYRVKETFLKLDHLWNSESKFLLSSLNTRWIMSAADSYIDHSPNHVDRALALTVASLVNTVKIYETEKHLYGIGDKAYDQKRLNDLRHQRLSLYDGTSGFAVGTDDTLRNMRWRLDDVCKGSIVGDMLQEIFSRLQEHDTAYFRFRKEHTRKRTSWWSR